MESATRVSVDPTGLDRPTGQKQTWPVSGFAAQRIDVEKVKGSGHLGIEVPEVFYNEHVREAEELVPLDEHGKVMPQMLYVDEKVVLTISVFAGVSAGRKTTHTKLRARLVDAAQVKKLVSWRLPSRRVRPSAATPSQNRNLLSCSLLLANSLVTLGNFGWWLSLGARKAYPKRKKCTSRRNRNIITEARK